jgi:ribose transport system substrate-binding protein
MKMRFGPNPSAGRLLVLGALIACLAVGISACGGSGSSSSSETGSSSTSEEASAGGGSPEEGATTASSGGSAEEGIKIAEERVATALGPPEFKSPGPAFDMGKAMKGKTIWFIATSMELPYVDEVAKAFGEAVEYAGGKLQIYDGKGETAVQAAGIEKAVASGADLIWLQAVDPKIMQAQMAEAKAAGIPVIDSNSYEPGSKPLYGSWIHTGYSTEEQGTLGIDYAIAQNHGEFHALWVTAPFFTFFEQRQKAMEAELEELCPEKCSMTVQKVEFTELAQTPLKVQSEITKDPSINVIIPSFELQVPYILQAIKAAGKEGIEVQNTGGLPEEIKSLAEGTAEFVSTDPDYAPWDGWAATDLAGRALAGEAPQNPFESFPPIRLFTKESPPKTSGNRMETDFIGEYKKLWEGL